MSDIVFGYHAVESLIRRESGRIATLHVQADRQDKRMHALLELARNQGVAVMPSDKADLDQRAPGRHQGVVALLHAGESREAVGMITESDLLDCIAESAPPRRCPGCV